VVSSLANLGCSSKSRSSLAPRSVRYVMSVKLKCRIGKKLLWKYSVVCSQI